MSWLVGSKVTLELLASQVDESMGYPKCGINAATGEPDPKACGALCYAEVEPHPSVPGLARYWFDRGSDPFVTKAMAALPRAGSLKVHEALSDDWTPSANGRGK